MNKTEPEPQESKMLKKRATPYTLDDKYTYTSGHALMSGVQALVRLPMVQRQRDALAGKNTAGFISGYRGSPLGNYDQLLQKSKPYLDAQHIVFQPGVNEELAATAIWGTQQLGFAPVDSNKYDGVFGLWYGKGPGVDRSADVFKHANMAGTTPWGGVLVVAGDDHVAKSSTAAHQSDHIFKACGLPVFFPANVQEILDFGLHAFAMSRYAGVWAGMKTIQDIVESSAVVDLALDRVQIALPSDFALPAAGVHIRWPDTPLAQEERLFNYKWYAALAYIRANRLNYDVFASADDRLGIIASGKAYNDTRQALQDLGLDQAACQRIGLRLHKVGVVWPLEAQSTREFATGLREILVVEEKRQIIEYQLKEELYNWRADVRPHVVGKFDEPSGDFSGGEWSMPNPSAHTLLRAHADLSPRQIALAIAKRLLALGVDAGLEDALKAKIESLQAPASGDAVAARPSFTIVAVDAERAPWFCSGCPHNTSTRVPAGSRAMAGIGCHYMVLWMNRQTAGFTQMGGEGVPWVGQQPFSHEKHVFANLGDGTYFHSGLLAIRQSIAAGVNITYKLLYNDAVAMTGGQAIGERSEGLSVAQIVHSLKAEGASRIAVVSETPTAHEALKPLAELVQRDDFDALQLSFRETAGCSVIVYQQTCATEKRRRRKRGILQDHAARIFINPEVCEGCGDCAVQSNCLSIEPLETPLGRKRQINQSTCNMDASCVKGFCPSFLSVTGANLKKPQSLSAAHANPLWDNELPLPAYPSVEQSYSIVIAGVGGTGVITLGQTVGTAAYLDGLGVITQDAAGLAQKGGATWSHIQLAQRQEMLYTTHVGEAASSNAADLVIACDAIVSAQTQTTQHMHAQKTHLVINQQTQATAQAVQNPDWQNPGDACVAQLARQLNPAHAGLCNAAALAERYLGDSIYAGAVLLGFAWQKAWLPISLSSLEQAFVLNGTAVKQNLQAFELGRVAAHAPDRLEPSAKHTHRHDEVNWVQRLSDYQNAAYAKRFSDFVDEVKQAESALSIVGKTPLDLSLTKGSSNVVKDFDRLGPNGMELSAEPSANPTQSYPLTQAVAAGLYHLMAYKDEYEVARLYTDGDYVQRLRDQFDGPVNLHFHLAAPIIAKTNSLGQPQKRRIPASLALPSFAVLAKFKFLRGSAFDPFGYSAERKMERELITEYQSLIRRALAGLNANTLDHAIQLAQSALRIRGYGHVKEAAAKAVRKEWGGGA